MWATVCMRKAVYGLMASYHGAIQSQSPISKGISNLQRFTMTHSKCEFASDKITIDNSGSFVQRQKRIAIYHVKKFVKESQLWKQTLSILPDFLENWHFLSHFVWKSTKTLKLLRIFDEIFDVINGDPFLTLYKTSANKTIR